MISDLEARKIASEWHGGQGTALYALSSTGAIDTARMGHRAYYEVVGCIIDNLQDEEGVEALQSLLAYVKHHGQRGQITGWGDVTW